jgi:hypothetical protein
LPAPDRRSSDAPTHRSAPGSSARP